MSAVCPERGTLHLAASLTFWEARIEELGPDVAEVSYNPGLAERSSVVGEVCLKKSSLIGVRVKIPW